MGIYPEVKQRQCVGVAVHSRTSFFKAQGGAPMLWEGEQTSPHPRDPQAPWAEVCRARPVALDLHESPSSMPTALWLLRPLRGSWLWD